MKKTKNNWQISFCIGLIIISILFAITIIIRKPTKITTKQLYNTANETSLETVKFPLEQQIILQEDTTQISLYFGDDSINQYDYHISLTDKNENKLFDEEYHNYKSNIVLIGNSNVIPAGEYHLKLTCDECNNVNIEIANSLDKKNELKNMPSKSLRLMYEAQNKNNSFYWYSIMGIIVAFTIYPLARGENYEKK